MKRILLVLWHGAACLLHSVCADAFPAARLPITTRSPSTSISPTTASKATRPSTSSSTKPSNTITLNAVEIDFHEVTVTAGGQTQTAKVSSDEKNEMATFTVDKKLPAGAATVHIKYTGHLNDKLRGLYLSTYNGRKYEVSQMEATDARVAFPSFDEPSYKATFDITAIVDKGDTAISNDEIVSDTPGPGDKHTIKFATSPKMSSYLVALTVGDWKCAHDEVDGIKLGVCTVPGKENLTHFPLEATKAILHYYNNYYGIKYPLPKLDQIAVPDFQAGAMENWGAIIYRETALLIDDKTASVRSQAGSCRRHRARSGAPVVWRSGHHCMVGRHLAQRRLRHLDDAASRSQHGSRTGWSARTWSRTRWTLLASDAVKNTRPIHQEADSRGEIESLFDGIAYGKTAAVLHMLESYLGPETFRAGVNLYLKEHAYGNATASDFWNAMARASKKPIDQIMPTFVMQAGAPFVGVEAKCDERQHHAEAFAEALLQHPGSVQRSPTIRSGKFRSAPRASASGSRQAAVLPADRAPAAVHPEGLLEVCLPRRRSAGLLPLRLRHRRAAVSWEQRPSKGSRPTSALPWSAMSGR